MMSRLYRIQSEEDITRPLVNNQYALRRSKSEFMPPDANSQSDASERSRGYISQDTSSQSDASESSFERNNSKISETTAIKSAHLTNEYVRLRDFLGEVDARVLKDMLLRTLSYRNSRHIVALGMLFPRKQFPSYQNYHCVRCHKEYSPNDNSYCHLPHPTSHVKKTNQDAKGANFSCTLCKLDFHLNRMYFYDENVNSYLTGFCFTGKHTTDPRKVDYGHAAKPCSDAGCLEVYV